MNEKELLQSVNALFAKRGIRSGVILLNLADGRELQHAKGNKHEVLELLCAHAEIVRCERAFEWLPTKTREVEPSQSAPEEPQGEETK